MMTSAAETPSPRVDIRRNAAAVIRHGAGTIGIERDGDDVGVAGQRLVDRVVDDLVDHVVQTGAIVGIADIHARPLADGVQALQHLDGIGTIFGGRAGFGLRDIGHSASGLSRFFERRDSLRITARTPRGL
ncbi:hypothetical protein ABIA24_000064 [Sinorhizobium fredii]